MNVWSLLPTKKVTAFVLGGALTLIGLWLAVDVLMVLGEWPGPMIVGAFVIVVGFLVAWFVPETVWNRVQGHIDVEVTPTEDGTVQVEGEVTLEEKKP
jgi:membrane associated rhomboid family serine protease